MSEYIAATIGVGATVHAATIEERVEEGGDTVIPIVNVYALCTGGDAEPVWGEAEITCKNCLRQLS